MTAPSGRPLPIVKDPNRLNDRQAMGLPDSLVERVPHDVFAGHADLFALPPADLAAVCADENQKFARRYAAGSLLALTGDPRIRPGDPETVPVPAARCEIGLPPERVAEVVRQWADVGVLESWIRKETPATGSPSGPSGSCATR